MCNERRFGLDMSQFASPVQVFLTLKASSLVYTADAQSALTSGTFHIVQSMYIDRSKRVVPHGDQVLTLPTRYFQSYNSRSFTPASTTEVQSVDLLSFRKGNLIGMIIHGIDNSAAVGTTSFIYNSLSDFTIIFNGVQVYRAVADNYKLQQLQDSQGAHSYHTIASTKYYRIEPCFIGQHWGASGHSFNYGLKLNGQALQAQFTSSSTNAQSIKVIYVYDALIAYNSEAQEIVL